MGYQQPQPQYKDYPTDPSMGWAGYYNHTDPSLLPNNVLTAGSKNCFIPSKDKIVTRKGSRTLAQPFTTIFFFGSGTGTFVIGETVTGGTSDATGVIVSVFSGQLEVSSIVGNFEDAETITGGTSGATGVLNIQTLCGGIDGHYKKFSNKGGQNLEIRTFAYPNPPSSPGQIYQALYTRSVTFEQEFVDFHFTPVPVSQTLPSVNNSGSKVYFTEFFDNTANKARLIWVDGAAIRSWSGAIAEITAISTNDLTIAESSWASLGFDGGIDDGSGDIFIMVNGIPREVLSANFNSNTITVDSAAGITVGDLAADGVFSSNAGGLASDFDFAKTIKNHVIYGNFKSRQIYGSNALNVDASVLTTSSAAVQDDLVIGDPTSYAGTFARSLKFNIVTITPPPQRNFGSASAGTDLDTGVFTGEHTGTSRDHYVIVIATPAPLQTANVFINGSSAGSFIIQDYDVVTPYTLSNGISFYISDTNTAYSIGTGWELYIGGQDYFDVYQDNEVTPLDANQPVSSGYSYNGVSFSWASFTGHALGDTWTVSLEPKVTYAWADFFYSVPARKPGQGFVAYLPSNFWTAGIQEDVLYLSDQRGGWSFLELQLSADLLTETVIIQPLKQENASKPIFPYMLGYMDNSIIYVTDDKKLDMISRKEFLQLPQIGYLSDPVKLDFDSLSFIGGNIEYWDKKLWISSPGDGITLCYDNVREYWQPPQEIPEVGFMSTTLIYNSILGQFIESLIGHSTIRNQTNQLFIGRNDNGGAFQVRMRTGYLSYGNRWSTKGANMTFLEGYMLGKPNIVMSIFQGINGCAGIKPHSVEPILCIPPDRSPLGEGSLGSHSLGSDENIVSPHFKEIYPFSLIEFDMAALDLYCDDLDQNWSILSMGMNALFNNTGNSVLTKDIPINLQ